MADQNVSLFDLLLLPENFHLAWRKAKKYYSQLEIWHDEIAISKFELNLEEELQKIREQFRKGQYKLSPLLPLPLPKKINFENPEESKNRQAFCVNVADQVAWLAFVNVVGPHIDKLMPAWSYGNRLYRAAWFEHNEYNDDKRLKIGPYRHSPGHIYRKFQHSWPLYKRHVLLTIKKMVSSKTQMFVALNEADEKEAQFQDTAAQSQDKLKYREADYWKKPTDSVFWAGIDLKTFYPNIRNEVIQENLIKHLLKNDQKHALLAGLLKDLLAFSTDIPSSFLAQDLESVDPLFKEGIYSGIPTYLMVGGFLANVAMLDIDLKIMEISKERQVAHFRYVDDHIILSHSFDGLVNWVKEYKSLLAEYKIGPQINADKIEPKEMVDYLGAILEGNTPIEDSKTKAITAARLNPRFPSPLMTTALAQISTLGQNDFDILSNDEQSKRLGELEHLLLTEFPEREIRESTRISFAASKIATIAPKKRWNIQSIISLERKLNNLKEPKARPNNYANDRRELKKEIEKESRKLQKSLDDFYKRYFLLLAEAFCRHSEKARLLKHIMLYVQKTGYDGFGQILECIKKIKAANKLAASHLLAVFLQTTSNQIIKSALEIGNKDLLYTDRRAYIRFINAAFKKIDINNLSTYQNTYYLDEAKNMYVWARAIAQALLKNETEIKIPSNRSVDIGSLWGRLEFNRAAWLWWFERYRSGSDVSVPDVVWLGLCKTLKADDHLEAILLRLYPTPSDSKIIEAYSQMAATELERDLWLQDRIATQVPTSNVGNDAPSLNVETISLLDWINWTSKQDGNPNDPRIGEWTALEIMHRVISTSNSIGNRSRKSVNTYHPVSYQIPISWTRDPALRTIPFWTWETWKSEIHKQENRIDLITDPKILHLYSSWGNKEADEQISHELYWAGFLMLCLLRKNFGWPPEWNLPGQQRMNNYWILKSIQTLNCSSRTTAILEACLSARTRETSFLKNHPTFAGEDADVKLNDTVLDPRVMKDFQDLLEEIRKAQEVLQDYQMTVLQHMPRQLIPMSINQLGHFAEKNEAEND